MNSLINEIFYFLVLRPRNVL